MPVTVASIVEAARALLVGGGIEAVTVRDVARRLGVSAPALYKHVESRGEIVDRLGAACLDELTATVVSAVDADPGGAPRDRVLAAGFALHRWAHEHPAEFALLFATPTAAFDRTDQALSHQAGLRLGTAMLAPLVDAARAGRLRGGAVAPAVLPQLHAWRDARELPMTDGQLWTALTGFHELLGLVTVEAFGQLGFALPDAGAYMRVRLEELVDRLVA